MDGHFIGWLATPALRNFAGFDFGGAVIVGCVCPTALFLPTKVKTTCAASSPTHTLFNVLYTPPYASKSSAAA